MLVVDLAVCDRSDLAAGICRVLCYKRAMNRVEEIKNQVRQDFSNDDLSKKLGGRTNARGKIEVNNYQSHQCKMGLHETGLQNSYCLSHLCIYCFLLILGLLT